MQNRIEFSFEDFFIDRFDGYQEYVVNFEGHFSAWVAITLRIKGEEESMSHGFTVRKDWRPTEGQTIENTDMDVIKESLRAEVKGLAIKFIRKAIKDASDTLAKESGGEYVMSQDLSVITGSGNSVVTTR